MQGLVAHANALIQIYGENKYGYVYGAQGETITQYVLDDMKRKYGSAAPGGPSYYEEERVKKWIGHKAADCSGLIMTFFQALNIYKYDMTAHGLMNKTVEIKRENLKEGDLAFKLDASKKAVHVGIYVGDGYFVHARGTDYGVVRTAEETYKWTTYGRMTIFIPDIHWAEPYFDYLIAEKFNYSNKSFDLPLTRGEYFAAKAKEHERAK